MNDSDTIRINKNTFIQSIVILAVLMILAGILTLVVPSGLYDRSIVNGREVIIPDSYHQIASPNYPLWRWLTAPVEVLWGPDSLTIIVIILFIMIVSGAFTIMQQSGVLNVILASLIARFAERKYTLLLLISFFFMAIGAFFGIFEETIPLVPIIVGLSISLGWDSLVGLGMSILATNLGFSAAISNPFTIGVAQEIAELPLFSGAWYRLIIFAVIYLIFAIFITRYARMIEKEPQKSPVYKLDRKLSSAFSQPTAGSETPTSYRSAIIWLGVFFILIIGSLMIGPIIPAISDFLLPIVGLLFLFAGFGVGLLSGNSFGKTGSSFLGGVLGLAPGIVLILMAASIKHIVTQGEVMDTILFSMSQILSSTPPYITILLIYLLALVIEIFIGSGSAKAFLLMPILTPIGDLVGINRQLVVLAYCFGDGFSNLAYPTNPVLLIVLGLTVVSYSQWMRWTMKLWIWIILATVIFLLIGYWIGYGPF